MILNNLSGNASEVRNKDCKLQVKRAVTMALGIGATAGGVFGTVAAFRHGLRGQEFIRIVGKNIFQVSGTFGVFMTVAAALRCW